MKSRIQIIKADITSLAEPRESAPNPTKPQFLSRKRPAELGATTPVGTLIRKCCA